MKGARRKVGASGTRQSGRRFSVALPLADVSRWVDQQISGISTRSTCMGAKAERPPRAKPELVVLRPCPAGPFIPQQRTSGDCISMSVSCQLRSLRRRVVSSQLHIASYPVNSFTMSPALHQYPLAHRCYPYLSLARPRLCTGLVKVLRARRYIDRVVLD